MMPQIRRGQSQSAIAATLAGLGLALAVTPALTLPATATTYAEQIRQWSRPDDIHTWIAANFTYDRDRAIALSETQRARGTRFAIYRPDQFFRRPSGICVDVSRFAVETMRSIAPDVGAKYLLIKFDPVRIRGNVLRMHWLASFQRGGTYYFFADSYFPTRLAGPFDSVGDFVNHYQDARGRTIVSYRLVDTYRKQRRKLRKKQFRKGKQIAE